MQARNLRCPSGRARACGDRQDARRCEKHTKALSLSRPSPSFFFFHLPPTHTSAAATPLHRLTSLAAATGIAVIETPTTPIPGQKTGTSGLRKKTREFAGGSYLANWVQSLFDSLGADAISGQALGLGGDGRYFNAPAAQTIIKHAAAAGFAKVVVGRGAIMATPAMSALIRRRGLFGGLIMSASHNPGGPDEDWGIKFNAGGGEPAPEKVTDAIYGFTQGITTLRAADMADVDLTRVGPTTCGGGFEVEVIDPVADYLATLQEVFDFPAIKALLARPDFTMTFDAMHAVTGAYAGPILVDSLGADPASILNGVPKEDFGGGHPDPNLTYAHDLVARMGLGGGKEGGSDDGAAVPDFGAACDGDADRNMVLGSRFFVTPSDSVAIIAAHAKAAIPYFKHGLKGVARSMPTSAALDRVAAALDVECYEVPTGW